MHKSLDTFDYTFIDNKSSRTLFLLHGTGGSKNDFVFLDGALGQKYNLVGIQGNVDENGMSRFFRRMSFGVFDQENIKEETKKLHDFISAWIDIHNILPGDIVALGYSNGANMLLATLFYYSSLIKNLVLLHPMMPFKIKRGSLNLSTHKIFVTNGIYDQMIPESGQTEVIEILTSCKAALTIKEYPSAHEISTDELNDVVSYLNSLTENQ